MGKLYEWSKAPYALTVLNLFGVEFRQLMDKEKTHGSRHSDR